MEIERLRTGNAPIQIDEIQDAIRALEAMGLVDSFMEAGVEIGGGVPRWKARDYNEFLTFRLICVEPRPETHYMDAPPHWYQEINEWYVLTPLGARVMQRLSYT